MIQRR